MANAASSLPPAKRFKLLYPSENSAHDLPAALQSRPYCLPAKKRIFALPDPPICPNLPKKTDGAGKEEEDDGVFCSICRGTDGIPSDPIVFCDGCDLSVHASCYGNPLVRSIPEGDWFCDRCREGGGKVQCCLCPVKGGAMKRTTSGGWAHVACALLVPEVFFSDPLGREGVDISMVPVRRWGLRCCLCGSTEGCVLECSEPRCELGFHVMCGVEAGLCLEYRESKDGALVVGFCRDHTILWDKQRNGKFTFVPRVLKKRKRQF